MELVVKHFKEMKEYADINSGDIERNLKSKHKSKIFYSKDSGYLGYEIKIDNPKINIPSIKEIRFDWYDSKLVIRSALRCIKEFSLVIQDIFDCIMNLETCENYKIVTTIKERLLCWRNFVGRNIAKGIEKERERGLFGELSTLKYLLEEGEAKAIESWCGCLKKSKDFELKDVEIETKTKIIGSINNRIHINGEEQLFSDKDLYINVHFISESEEGIELHELVESIIDRISEGEVDKLLDKLVNVGYTPIKKFQSGIKFLIEESIFYEVKEGFPRNKANLGTCCLEYDVDLSAITNFMRDNYK